jgi:hypothetical protein
MKEKVLFLLCDKTCFRFFIEVIKKLIADGRYEVFLISRYEDLTKDVQLYFPLNNIYTGYNPHLIENIHPDIIICYQIWWWGITPILEHAKKKNIPILMYEHGSLIYLCEYFLARDETLVYRGDISLCSHVACWGERNRECWVSYGILSEKIYLTGAPQYDSLYKRNFVKKDIYDELNIDYDKKIILLCTSSTQNLEWKKRLIDVTKQIEQFIDCNPKYQLVVKPHPSEMIWFDKITYPYSDKTIVIVNPLEDCNWEGVKRVNIDDVIAASFAVISMGSSLLIAPVILDIPIIHILVNSPLVYDFAYYCKDVFWNLSENMEIASMIPNIEDFYNKKEVLNSSILAAQLNYNNDGRASERLVELIEKILQDKMRGEKFYISEEAEFLECIKRYPFLPYPYMHLIKCYMKNSDYFNEQKWLDIYRTKFRDPTHILKELSMFYFQVKREYVKVVQYLEEYNRYKPLDNNLRQIFEVSLMNAVRLGLIKITE